jgi:hypothetical protein
MIGQFFSNAWIVGSVPQAERRRRVTEIEMARPTFLNFAHKVLMERFWHLFLITGIVCPGVFYIFRQESKIPKNLPADMVTLLNFCLVGFDY